MLNKARRVLDRLVGINYLLFFGKGFKRFISWKSTKCGCSSSSRKEREIQAFIPQEYWDLNAYFKKDKLDFSAKLLKIDQKV